MGTLVKASYESSSLTHDFGEESDPIIEILDLTIGNQSMVIQQADASWRSNEAKSFETIKIDPNTLYSAITFCTTTKSGYISQ
ncbi:hypothetical protein PROFUN_00291 [Planoprotostelium fungivorum]|uniref:Uncharacterized protein n=1 Tax=Planoprotostelium fungivorum TaxID=1890364 RepID=A0A2P6NXY3_9EUKA|nr:hypothetical protein PROFUN_00291 [Planoprotostelium fungivorum]